MLVRATGLVKFDVIIVTDDDGSYRAEVFDVFLPRWLDDRRVRVYGYRTDSGDREPIMLTFDLDDAVSVVMPDTKQPISAADMIAKRSNR